MARSRASLKKSIYLMRRVLFLRESVDDEDLQVYSCKGKINLADPFTKCVFEPNPFFQARLHYMGVGSGVKTLAP